MEHKVQCSGCHEQVAIQVARLAEGSEFETDAAFIRYLCPVCVILEKNAAMQAQLLKVLAVKK